jgi:hypothetical protein
MSGGGALGLGKSKSQQQSQGYTDSSSYGESASVSGDVSASSSSGYGVGSSSSSQSIAFEDLYRQLFGGATGAAMGGVANGPELGATARQLFTGGSQFLEGLGGDAGQQYLESRLSSDNPVLQDQIDQLREDTGQLFTDKLNPAITADAVAGGTLGGGRQGVAQGMAMDSLSRSFTQGVTQLRSNDIAMRDAAAMNVAQNSLTAASTGLGALPSMLDLATDAASPELGIYAKLSSILGGPTVLGESSSSNFNTNTAESASQAFSRSFGTQSSRSYGTNSSSGKASGWNFNMSGYGGVGASGGG